MPTYRTAPDDARKKLDTAVAKWHGDLKEIGVTFQLLFAHAQRDENTGEPKGPALKHANWPAAAVVRVNSLKDRVEGKSDCTVTLDGDTWDNRHPEEQMAILDHEIQHVEVCRTKPKKLKKGGKIVLEGGGELVLDDAHRPKLKLRPHDYQHGGFDLIAERHKKHSLEVQHVQNLAGKKWVQGELFVG